MEEAARVRTMSVTEAGEEVVAVRFLVCHSLLNLWAKL